MDITFINIKIDGVLGIGYKCRSEDNSYVKYSYESRINIWLLECKINFWTEGFQCLVHDLGVCTVYFVLNNLKLNGTKTLLQFSPQLSMTCTKYPFTYIGNQCLRLHLF